MKPENNRLEDIEITRPCPASWEAMTGGDKARHCESCDLQVHNLAAMSRDEGESLLASRGPASRLCVRMEFHPDGSCKTTDNPTPSSVSNPKPGSKVAAALALGAGLLAACTGDKARPDRVDENANLSVKEAHQGNVLQGSIAAEVAEDGSDADATFDDIPVREHLMMLGYVGPAIEEDGTDECESADQGEGETSQKENSWTQPLETKGEVAPRRVIMGSPAPSGPKKEKR